MQTFDVFHGNCPRNVSKDAKYSVRHADARIGLVYSTADGERWHVTTKAHPDLADMVNDVKRKYGRRPNGPFYINEYKQVIVPVGDDAQYYFAGIYDQSLRFKFEGKTISGEPKNLDGKPLRPGDTWTGPHAGIPYVLTATADDVYYRISPRPDVERRVRLSVEKGRSAAQQIARLLSAFKGVGGGRFYVNEFCSVFSPISGADGLKYIYIGQIELDSWFPNPISDRVSVD